MSFLRAAIAPLCTGFIDCVAGGEDFNHEIRGNLQNPVSESFGDPLSADKGDILRTHCFRITVNHGRCLAAEDVFLVMFFDEIDDASRYFPDQPSRCRTRQGSRTGAS